MAALSLSNWAAKACSRGLLLAVLASASQAAPDGSGWSLLLHSDRHSDFSSLADLREDDRSGYRARSSRNLAYVEEEARVQRTTGAWTWSLLARSSATLVANRDAIGALRHLHGLGRDANDRQWNVDARLRGFSGFGAEVGHRFSPGPEWTGLVLVQALALTRLRDRHITGAADFEGATSTYGFDLRSRETNDRLDFPFRQDVAPRGAALLFGGEIGWKRGPWSLTAGMRDLGWLHWRQVPQQEFTLASRTRDVDAEGFVVYRPLVQGQNRQGGRTRTAPPRAMLAGGWQATPDGELRLRARHFQGFGWRPSAGWAQRFGTVETETSIDFEERRIVVDARWERWQLRLGFDRPDGAAQSRVFGIRYRAPW